MKKFFLPEAWGSAIEAFSFKPFHQIFSGKKTAEPLLALTAPPPPVEDTEMKTSAIALESTTASLTTTTTTTAATIPATTPATASTSSVGAVGKQKRNQKIRKNKKSHNEGAGEHEATLARDDTTTSTTTTTTTKHKVRNGRVEKRQSKELQAKKLRAGLLPMVAIPVEVLSEARSTTSQTRSTASQTCNTASDPCSATSVPRSVTSAPVGALKDRLKGKLMGGRFRYLNEQLYTMDSQSAEKLFEADRDAFLAYHEGYRHQVRNWPVNPLDRIIKMIKQLPKSLEIGDFGCGDGKLAQSVPNKVYSMDLVSTRPDIIACDMANTPLQPQSIDLAVYCLSLMGTNLRDYVLEANRVLRMGGVVYIAEIRSRFENETEFVRGLTACGFKLLKKDANNALFLFFQFKKVRDVGKVAVVPSFTLKPCLYRKR